MFGGELIFRRVGLGFLELELQLVEQPRRALGARSVNRALKLFDLKIEKRDQRAVIGHHGPCARQFSVDRRSVRLLRRTSARAAISAAFNASMSSGSEEGSGSTNHMESQNRTFEAPLFALSSGFFIYPTAVGRHVSCGVRQSMPDSR